MKLLVFAPWKSGDSSFVLNGDGFDMAEKARGSHKSVVKPLERRVTHSQGEKWLVNKDVTEKPLLARVSKDTSDEAGSSQVRIAVEVTNNLVNNIGW